MIIRKIFHLNKTYRIAKHNIPCYIKTLLLYNTLNIPYLKTEINSFSDIPDLYNKNYIVQNGIETYRTRKTIEKNLESNEIILAVYIPKGTKYWIGKYNKYLSKRIIFNTYANKNFS